MKRLSKVPQPHPSSAEPIPQTPRASPQLSLITATENSHWIILIKLSKMIL